MNPPPNLNAINDIIGVLSNENVELEKKNKELQDETNLLSKEVQNKAKEISSLEINLQKAQKEIENLNNKIKKDKKEIEELRFLKEKYEEKNYDLLANQKFEVEKERDLYKKESEDYKQKYEEEHKNLLELDKSFYQYKQEHEKSSSSDTEKIGMIENDLKKAKEEINNNKKIIEEKELKIKQTLEIVKNLQDDNNKLKTLADDIKRESFVKIENMKNKVDQASQSVFSTDKILNIVAENINNVFEQEFNLSYNRIIETIFSNFIPYTQAIFSSLENGDKCLHNDENLFLYNLKDIFFYIYFYVFNLKKSKEPDSSLSISSNDFTDEIINNLSNDIYKNNIIHMISGSSQNKINDYISNLQKLGIEEDSLKKIKEYYSKRNENFRVYLLNMIKSLVKKCTDTMKNNTIEMNNKVLYNFSNFTGEEYNFSKNSLEIFNDKVTNNQIEILLNLLKYPTEKITKISFNNNFNSDLSEYNIQKILLNLMTYNHDIMSLNFNICENLSNNIISYIIFSVQNLKSIRILSFESCNLNDGHIKVLVEGIKENQTVNTLMLRKNNITSQGAIYISEYINNNKNIKHLYLGNNKINGNGLKEMLKIMTTNNRNITSIDLSNNDFNINDFNALIDYFKTNPILNLLDISGNRIDLQSAVKLGSILNTMKNIKCINMSNMGINSDSTPILFKSAFSNEIILDDNNIEDIGLIMLIKALENNKNLKKLSFKNIKITGLGLTTILQFIDKPRDFKELHLENNKIDDINKIRAQVKDKQYKIYVSRSMVNPESLKDESLANEPNLIFV